MKNPFSFLVTLFLFIQTAYAVQVDTLLVYSNKMDKSIPNLVITPSNYNQERDYPVVYLLHGADGNYTNWYSLVPKIADLANQYQTIIVCPDGSKYSWYLDSPIDKDSQYETYITKELIPVVDKKYKTINRKEGRAITGLSMGGHGALYLAFRNPELFCATGSMSGGVDISKFPDNWKIAQKLGEFKDNKGLWLSSSVVNMTHLIKNNQLALIIDCGYDDFFYDVNISLHHTLIKSGISHTFITMTGAHRWTYWSKAVPLHFEFFSHQFSILE